MLNSLRQALLLSLLAIVVASTLAAGHTIANEQGDPARGQPEQVVLRTDLFSPPGEATLANDEAGYLSPMTAAATPFTHALLRWELTEPQPEALWVELRVSPDGEQWSDWVIMIPNDDLWVPEDGDLVVWSEITDVGPDMRFWQVRARPAPGFETNGPQVRQLDVNTVDARFGPAEPSLDAPASLATLNSSGVARPAVVSRTAWGNPDGQGSRATPAYRTVTHMVIHHTAEPNSLSGSQQTWADRVRAIWSFHTFTRGWGDIGYNYLIDPNGVIYEGRAGGDDAVGFHDTANFGSMGVAVIGTYSIVQPTAPSQTSLVNLLAWKANQRGINPHGQAFYFGCSRSSACNPFVSDAILPQITTHRNVTPGRTSCPGDSFEGLVPNLRQRVAERIAGWVPPPPPANLEILAVHYDRQELVVGELLQISFTVRNAGTVTIEGQAPEATRRADLGGAYDLSDSYVYDETECFLGTPGQDYPTFPKEGNRFRVLLGPVEAARQPTCAGETGGYPWRWGLNGPLAPGETREIIGFVRMRQPGTVTLQAGGIHEYVRYTANSLAPTSITVHPERQAPILAAYNPDLQALAHVYQLGAAPINWLARPNAAANAPRGAYLGSFGWDGAPVAWGVAGPLPDQPAIHDSFVIEQVRTFVAPVTGEYTFLVLGDDSAALWVNGTLLAWKGAADPYAVSEGRIWLEAGTHRLAFRHFELGGEARAGYLVREPEAGGFTPVRDGLLISPATRFGNRLFGLEGLRLVADDLSGVGVAAIMVSVNDGPWQETPGPLTQLGPLPDGSHTIRYHARDQLGNQSSEHMLTIIIDRSTQVFLVYLPLVGM
ncbi:MAG: N-acetylmuramoyl-L-alanine amidase [Oscillochloridaceae bacterium umkhey_bin13]